MSGIYWSAPITLRKLRYGNSRKSERNQHELSRKTWKIRDKTEYAATGKRNKPRAYMRKIKDATEDEDCRTTNNTAQTKTKIKNRAIV